MAENETASTDAFHGKLCITLAVRVGEGLTGITKIILETGRFYEYPENLLFEPSKATKRKEKDREREGGRERREKFLFFSSLYRVTIAVEKP